MARNRLCGTEKHAPRAGAREPGAAAATRRVEGASAAAAADADGPALLGSAVEGVDELAAFDAGGAAGDRNRLAPPRISTVLDMEEWAPMGSARDWEGTAAI